MIDSGIFGCIILHYSRRDMNKLCEKCRPYFSRIDFRFRGFLQSDVAIRLTVVPPHCLCNIAYGQLSRGFKKKKKLKEHFSRLPDFVVTGNGNFWIYTKEECKWVMLRDSSQMPKIDKVETQVVRHQHTTKWIIIIVCFSCRIPIQQIQCVRRLCCLWCGTGKSKKWMEIDGSSLLAIPMRGYRCIMCRLTQRNFPFLFILDEHVELVWLVFLLRVCCAFAFCRPFTRSHPSIII